MPNPKLPLVLGVILVVLYLLAQGLNWSVPALISLQHLPLYKWLTGLALAGVLWGQGWLSVTQKPTLTRKTQAILRLRQRHLWWGIGAIPLLWLHSVGFGYAYQRLLVGAFLLNVIIGLAAPRLLKVRTETYRHLWTLAHVSLSFLVFVLVLYHVYVGMAYN